MSADQGDQQQPQGEGEPHGGPMGEGEVDIDQVLKQRAGLHKAAVALEVAIASPAAGRASEWARGVSDTLRGVSRAWAIHTEVTEGPDSLFAEVVQIAPRLSNAVNRLKAEHVEVAGVLASEIESFATIADDADADWTDARRDSITTLLGRLTRHRQKGSDLLYQAYDVDLGGET